MTIAQQLEQKGIEKGIEIGRRETTLRISRNMLQNGFSRNEVMEMTGLTDDGMAQIHD